jgi:heterodisulfide reductase subunit C
MNELASDSHSLDPTLAIDINRLSHQSVELCYHCHKCTAGCPVIDYMEYGPDHILRMVSLGETDAVLRSHDIWLCAGCYMCAARCPNAIEIPAVMDALRQLAISRGYPASERDAMLFHRLFLGVVRQFGRSHEAVLLGLFKVLSHTPLLNDMGAGIGLFMRGKVPLLPDHMPDTPAVRRLFKRRHE